MADQPHPGPPDLRNRRNWAKFQSVFRKIIEQLHASGALTDDDIASPDQLWTKLDQLRESGRLEIIPVVDHRENLTEAAARHVQIGEYQLALMFYALFFEHTLNALISRRIGRCGKPERTAIDTIRSVSFEGKLSWLLDLLDLPSLNEKHRKVMSQVAQERNAFVHYKWNSAPMALGGGKQGEAKLKELAVAARKTVTYLRRYETRLSHEGLKGKLSAAARLERPADWD
jgi:hypothetical protein